MNFENQGKLKKNILIVEDEYIIALTMRRNLERIGYCLAGHAKTGEMAIQMAKDYSPDLIIMDINLGGGIDGIETAEQILKVKPIPIIFSTGNTDDHTYQRANKVCKDGFLTKPYDSDQFKESIESALTKNKTN